MSTTGYGELWTIWTNAEESAESSDGRLTTYPDGVVNTSANSGWSPSGAKNPDAYTIPERPPYVDNGALNDATDTVDPCAVISNV